VFGVQSYIAASVSHATGDDRVRNTKPALQMTADIVRAARIVTGQSQLEIARKAGTSQNQIWRLEQGRMKRGPSIDLLERIALACGRRLKLTLE
jgi:ribosome-binding protein aMBF1 (putative translation factor)